MKGDSQNLCRISDGIRIFPSYTKSVSLSSWICCHVIPIYSYTFPTITSANFEYNVRTPSTDYAWNHVFSMNTTYYSLIITNSVTRKEYIASRKLRSFFCIFATKRAPPVTSAYGTLFWSLRSVVFVADTKAQFFWRAQVRLSDEHTDEGRTSLGICLFCKPKMMNSFEQIHSWWILPWSNFDLRPVSHEFSNLSN